MARPLRITYPGAIYHITVRGNRKQDIFLDDDDRLAFLSELQIAIKHHNWLCHAYCLMGNHYHLLIETLEANLSDGMRDLNKDYAQGFNRRHDTVGHLLQGRFKSHIIERETYLLNVARYVVLNPVRAGMINDPADWQWSSYRATVGFSQKEDLLTTDWILGHFSENRIQAQNQYVDFVKAGIGLPSPFNDATHRSILGSPQFVHEMYEQADDVTYIKEIPREERLLARPSLTMIFREVRTRKERDKEIVFARVGCGYSVAEIARHLKLSNALVSEISREKR
jgi:putative transposase